MTVLSSMHNWCVFFHADDIIIKHMSCMIIKQSWYYCSIVLLTISSVSSLLSARPWRIITHDLSQQHACITHSPTALRPYWWYNNNGLYDIVALSCIGLLTDQQFQTTCVVVIGSKWCRCHAILINIHIKLVYCHCFRVAINMALGVILS